MLTEICQRLKNWFDLKSDHTPYGHYSGTITISNNAITLNGEIFTVPTAYFRLIDSYKNNGVHKVGDTLKDETFTGSIWLMVIPDKVVSIAADMQQWLLDYGNASKAPFSSESHKGYSYTKAINGGNSGAMSNVWNAFESDLATWRKI